MNLNAVRKRVEALERVIETRTGGIQDDVLSPRDVAVLVIEKGRLQESPDPESAMLAARIDGLLAAHGGATKSLRSKPMTPEEAGKALIAAAERTEEDEESYRQGWIERLKGEAS